MFYGAMLSESVIALVWAAAGVAFYGATGGLNQALTEFGQSGTVYDISTGLLGPVGGVLAITLPLLAVGALLTQMDFNVLWRYFSWSNQTLAMISLWVATAYLIKTHKNKMVSLITAMPATFMSAVSLTYILMAEEGLHLESAIAYPAGIIFAVCLFITYLIMIQKKARLGRSNTC